MGRPGPQQGTGSCRQNDRRSEHCKELLPEITSATSSRFWVNTNRFQAFFGEMARTSRFADNCEPRTGLSPQETHALFARQEAEDTRDFQRLLRRHAL